MPTIFIEGSYRFFIYAGDRYEPRHVHIERDDKIAKFWLDPVRIQTSGGFNRAEIVTLEKLVTRHNKIFQEKWNEYFNG